MKSENLYYKESGKFGIFGLIFLIIAGVVIGGILGLLSGWLIYLTDADWLRIPVLNELGLLFVNLLYTAPIGVALGFMIGKTAVPGKIRNIKLLTLLSSLFGIITTIFACLFWLNLANGEPIISYNYSDLSAAFDKAANYDLGDIFGWTPTGFALYAIWFLRALVIAGMAKVSVELGFNEKPFCENCGKWTKPVLVTSILDPSYNMSELKGSLEKGDLQMLTSMRNVDPNSKVKLKVVLHECTECSDDFFLSIAKISVKKDDEGEERENEKSIVKNLKIDKDKFEVLLDWRNKLTVKSN